MARGIEDRLHDVVVAGAAAEVPLERLAALLLRGRGVLLEVAGRCHDHARRAVATLQAVVPVKRVLDRVKLAVVREALDRGDLATIGLEGEQRAGLHGLPVQQDRAAAATGGVAPDIGAGKPKSFTP